MGERIQKLGGNFGVGLDGGFGMGFGGGFFGLSDVVPADRGIDVSDEFVGLHVGEDAVVADQDVKIVTSTGGNFVNRFFKVAAEAFTRLDMAKEDAGTEEFDTMVDGLGMAFMLMELEAEAIQEELDALAVAEELCFQIVRNDDVKIINIATVIFIAESLSDKMVQFVEENV